MLEFHICAGRDAQKISRMTEPSAGSQWVTGEAEVIDTRKNAKRSMASVKKTLHCGIKSVNQAIMPGG